MPPTDLLIEPHGRAVLSGKRIGAALAVGALGALGAAALIPSVANADVTPAPGPIAAENANGSDVYAAPPTAETPANGLFGSTKVSAQVLPVEGTFSGTPDLSGVIFTLTADSGPAVSTTCTTTVTGKCFISVSAPNTVLQGNVTYTLVQTSAPAGFFVNDAEVTVGRCLLIGAAVAGQCGPTNGGLSGTTDNQFVFADQGTNRTLRASVTSTVYPLPAVPVTPDSPSFATGLIEGAAFQLRNTATAEGEPLATATSDANGNLTFPGTFAPGTDYYLVQTGAAEGYTPVAGQIPVTVPVPATIAAANTPVVVAIENAPDIAAPLLVADSTTLTLGSPVVVRDVLANDNLYGADSYILSATSIHGAITVDNAPGCVLPEGQCEQVIYYLADPAHLGDDVVTYTVATRGGLSTSTDTITIKAVPVVTPPVVVTPVVVPVATGPILAKTGPQHVNSELAYGGAILALGLGLTVAGARRRNQV